MINVHAHGDAVVDETEVDACVIGSGGFPLEVGVIGVRPDGHYQLVAEVVVASQLVGVVSGKGGIGVARHVLLACLAPAQAELGGGKVVHALEEVLVLRVPCEGNRREEAPLVVGEAGSAVVACGSGDEVLVVEAVVGPSEEGDEEVFERRMNVFVDLVLVHRGGKGVGVVVEVLPGITGHEVYQMLLREGMVVVGVELEGLVVAELVVVFVDAGSVLGLVVPGLLGAFQHVDMSV